MDFSCVKPSKSIFFRVKRYRQPYHLIHWSPAILESVKKESKKESEIFEG